MNEVTRDGPRVPPVLPGTRPELAEVEARILAARGRVSPLYQVLLHSAPIAAGWERLLTAVRNESRVPPALRELAILRVAVLNRAAFEFDAHVPHARQAGLDDARIEALRAPAPDAARFSPLEALVLELTDTMTRDIDVPDALMARVQAQFDASRTVELVSTIAAYNMVSRVLVALRVTH
jgi:AhpD family alkylhydroperoxidase